MQVNTPLSYQGSSSFSMYIISQGFAIQSGLVTLAMSSLQHANSNYALLLSLPHPCACVRGVDR